MYIKSFIALTLLCLSFLPLKGQDKPVYLNDSTTINTDDIKEIKAKNFFDPSRAALLSAVFPGLGQAYNRKYWKIPIVWGGLFLGILLADAYNNELQFWRSELFLHLNGQTPTSGASQNRVEQIIQRYRRDRDQTIIYTFLWYGLNIVDAHVDAYLKEFEVNDQLSLKLKPYIDNNYMASNQVFGGISIVARFK